MNRYGFYLFCSAVCIVLSLAFLIYAYWDISQPKIGPVGDGEQKLTLIQILPQICTLAAGVIHLPLAIYQYRKHKKSK
ncbi:hypothetical protein PAENIP36_10050 [Paenibacillus sp. P36]